MTIEALNKLNKEKAFETLFKCCGCTTWAQKLAGSRPFKNEAELLNVSDLIWKECGMAEGLEAFSHHPKIGDLKSLEKKFASTKEWASGEQSGVDEATHHILAELATGNMVYENKFGFIFIVCATGKTADEMLVLLKARLVNDPEKEFEIAMNEQNEITHIRLRKLLA